jgi:predicted transcriptional regulator
LLFEALKKAEFMKMLQLNVQSPTSTFADIEKAAKTDRADRDARISFATPELLWEVLTLKRWELIKSLCGSGALSIREIARRVRRDVKAVHGDIHALLQAGVLQRDESGKIVFPYDAVKVEFLLRAA